MKYLYPEGALFQVVFVFRKSLFHDVPEQARIAFAGSESAVAHNPFQLRAHELSFALGFRVPGTVADPVDAIVSFPDRRFGRSQRSTALIRLATMCQITSILSITCDAQQAVLGVSSDGATVAILTRSLRNRLNARLI